MQSPTSYIISTGDALSDRAEVEEYRRTLRAHGYCLYTEPLLDGGYRVTPISLAEPAVRDAFEDSPTTHYPSPALEVLDFTDIADEVQPVVQARAIETERPRLTLLQTSLSAPRQRQEPRTAPRRASRTAAAVPALDVSGRATTMLALPTSEGALADLQAVDPERVSPPDAVPISAPAPLDFATSRPAVHRFGNFDELELSPSSVPRPRLVGMIFLALSAGFMLGTVTAWLDVGRTFAGAGACLVLLPAAIVLMRRTDVRVSKAPRGNWRGRLTLALAAVAGVSMYLVAAKLILLVP